MKKDPVRSRKLKILLERKNLDAAILFHPENILLASGVFPKAPFTACLVTNSETVYLICPWWTGDSYISENCVDDVITFDWLKSLEPINPELELINAIKKVAIQKNIKKIGIDGKWDCCMPSSTPSSSFTYKNVKSELKNVTSVITDDLSSDIHSFRAVKTDYEIEMLKKANKVAAQAAKTFYENALPGKSEIEVAAEISKAVLLAAGNDHITFTYCDPPQITSGPQRTLRANALTCLSTKRRLEKGDLVMLELGGCADGYWFDLTRTLVAGGGPQSIHLEMADTIKKAAKFVYDAYCNGCDITGVLAQIGLDALKKAGFEKGIVHGLGHGVGFAYHEAIPGLGPGSTNVIKPNMVTSMEPGLYIPGVGGIRIEENVVWGKNSIFVLSNFHNDLDCWKE